ncbi:MAG: hypothetical protein ACE147_00775 [Candidatus Methylomirabilales bacterium]
MTPTDMIATLHAATDLRLATAHEALDWLSEVEPLKPLYRRYMDEMHTQFGRAIALSEALSLLHGGLHAAEVGRQYEITASRDRLRDLEQLAA